MKFVDMVEFELNIQKDRLRYIDATLNRKAHCDFPPRKIYVEPTNICNYRCVHCVHDGAMKRKPVFLSPELFKRRIDEIKHLRLHTKIQFTGVGEPLLHKGLFEIIRHAADLGFFTLMNTNASLLTLEACERLVASGLDYLHVSIDGLCKDTYEGIRRGGRFETVIENLFNLFQARHDANGYHLAVILGIVAQERNRHEVGRFLEFFEPFPFHHVVAGELFNHMGAIEEASRAYSSQQSGPVASYPICNTPWDLLSINADGMAVGCNYDYDNRFVIGDLNEQGFLELWNSRKMQEFRQSVLDRNYACIEGNGPLCSECTIKWLKDYWLPRDFSEEVERMEGYLARAIHRCARHAERNAELRKREQDVLTRKGEILKSLFSQAGN